MKDPFAKDLAIDSPTRDSLKHVDGCCNKNLFKSSSFANSRRALQSGADKISRTFRSVRNTFGNLSQVCGFQPVRRKTLKSNPAQQSGRISIVKKPDWTWHGWAEITQVDAQYVDTTYVVNCNVSLETSPSGIRAVLNTGLRYLNCSAKKRETTPTSPSPVELITQIICMASRWADSHFQSHICTRKRVSNPPFSHLKDVSLYELVQGLNVSNVI